jgi:hypothetical protein
MLSVIMLSVVMLNVVMLNAVMLNAVMLNAVMLNAVMLNAIMLSVIILSVGEPVLNLDTQNANLRVQHGPTTLSIATFILTTLSKTIKMQLLSDLHKSIV